MFTKKNLEYGPTNLIYADGDGLFIHGHVRIQADGKIAPPGLFMLCRFYQSEKNPAVSKTEL